MTMRTADPMTLPLEGTLLVEASAGTGKTFTIATVYLRLLIEARRDLDQVLVVTFTEAATQELRERVRARIAEALHWLARGDRAALADQDPALHRLLAALADPDQAAGFLADQLSRMDQAAIYTIHGFCKRMLETFGFETGTAAGSEFLTDDGALRRQAAADFWRQRVAAAPAAEAAWILAAWPGGPVGPGGLLDALGPTLASDDLALLPQVSAASLAETRTRFIDCVAAFRRAWPGSRARVEALLSDKAVIKQQSYNKGVRQRALQAGDALAADDGVPTPLPKALERLTPAMLAAQTKAGAVTPTDPVFDLCAAIRALDQALDRLPHALFLGQARAAIRAAMARAKADLRAVYYDDLLSGLDRALAGPGGERLAGLIRARLPVALVDEFQDTDPAQARIFQAIYADRPDTCLLFCGDPKQAIYGFRGADIFAYMQAKRDTPAQARFTLGTNWRSSSRMVGAFNALFERADNPFLFAPAISYQAVQPSPRADRAPLLVDGVEPVPLQIGHLVGTESNQTQGARGWIRAPDARVALADYCAERVAELLSLADQGKARLGAAALRSADIAVLVRTGTEGERVQQALRRCGVPSVTLGQASVFESEDADALALVLAAVASPQDEALLRAALATLIIEMDARTLDALGGHEQDWEAVVGRFTAYRTLWQERGFISAFQALLDQEGVPERLLRRADGERRVTNLLQLGELLQVASSRHPGITALLAWFDGQRSAGAAERSGDDQDQLRLESDRGLVSVMTLHKSKGLEFPVVLIPFPWSYFQGKSSSRLALFHDRESGAAQLDLGSDELETHRRLADVEALAEQLRLFYVGVTRAAKLCILGWGKVNGADRCGLAYLLHRDHQGDHKGDQQGDHQGDHQGDQQAAPDRSAGRRADRSMTRPANRLAGLDDAAIRAELDALAAAAPGCIEVRQVGGPVGRRWSPAAGDPKGLRASPFSGTIEQPRRWRVSSYSSLVAGRDAERPDRDAAGPDARPSVAEQAPSSVDPVFRLPAGIPFGVFVHGLLEKLDFASASGAELSRTVSDAVARFRPPGGPTDGGTPPWPTVLTTLLSRVLDTPLVGRDGSDGPCLRQVGRADRLDELEFHLPVAALDPALLRAALAGEPRYADSATGLSFADTRGLLRGFIDLVFRHRGRYYIVDYKTNLLGDRFEAYDAPSMAAAIRLHRYDLQYLIYTLALHRYLAQRVAGYDYQRDFGGVRYLFLRGMHPANPPGTGVWADRPPLDLIERLGRLFAPPGQEPS